MARPQLIDQKPKRIGTCVYCGRNRELTDDHIPPKDLFAKPRPYNLITVPACLTCNKSASKDDEYFRMRLCLNDAARGHPDVNGNLPSIFRSLDRPQARGLRTSLLADWRNVEVKSSGGLYLGRRSAFQVDMKRIFRVVARIVKGLYFHETGNIFCSDHGVRVISNETLSEQDPDTIAEFKSTILQPLVAAPLKSIGNRTFAYRYCLTDVPSVSGWGLVFYDRVQFVALTGPKSEIDAVREDF
jgi:hypothetical protein